MALDLCQIFISAQYLARGQMDGMSQNFIYAFILARSRLGLLPVIFHKFVRELWPLIDGFYSMKNITVILWQFLFTFYAYEHEICFQCRNFIFLWQEPIDDIVCCSEQENNLIYLAIFSPKFWAKEVSVLHYIRIISAMPKYAWFTVLWFHHQQGETLSHRAWWGSWSTVCSGRYSYLPLPPS